MNRNTDKTVILFIMIIMNEIKIESVYFEYFL